MGHPYTPTLFLCQGDFCWSKGRTVLRHVTAAAKKPGMPKRIDFRSLRAIHSSLMGTADGRPKIIREQMGHQDVDVNQNIYGKTWWEERVMPYRGRSVRGGNGAEGRHRRGARAIVGETEFDCVCITTNQVCITTNHEEVPV